VDGRSVVVELSRRWQECEEPGWQVGSSNSTTSTMPRLANFPLEILDDIFEHAQLDKNTLASFAQCLGTAFVPTIYRQLYMDIAIDDGTKRSLITTLLDSEFAAGYVRRVRIDVYVDSAHTDLGLTLILKNAPKIRVLNFVCAVGYWRFPDYTLNPSIMAMRALVDLTIHPKHFLGLSMQFLVNLEAVTVQLDGGDCEDHHPAAIDAVVRLEQYIASAVTQPKLRTVMLALRRDLLDHAFYNHTPEDRWGYAVAIIKFDKNGRRLSFYMGSMQVSRVYTACGQKSLPIVRNTYVYVCSDQIVTWKEKRCFFLINLEIYA
jgi:hypothetical protein